MSKKQEIKRKKQQPPYYELQDSQRYGFQASPLFSKTKDFTNNAHKVEEVETISEQQVKSKNTLFVNILLSPLNLVFYWLIPFVLKYHGAEINFKDLDELQDKDKCEYYEESFKKVFRKNKRLLYSLYRVSFVEYFVKCASVRALSIICALCTPFFLERFLSNLSPLLNDEIREEFDHYRSILPENIAPVGYPGYRTNNYDSWIYMVITLTLSSFSYLFEQFYLYLSLRCSIRFRLLLTNIIFQKIFNLSNKVKHNYSKGKILNYIANEVYFVQMAHIYAHELYMALVLVVFVFFFVFNIMGISALPSLIVFFIVYFIIFLCTLSIFLLRVKYFNICEERINVMKEGLHNMLFIKMFGNLKNMIFKKIVSIRNDELVKQRTLLFFNSLTTSFSYFGVPLMVFAGFFTYYIINKDIDISVFILGLSYFGLLRTPLGAISVNGIVYYNGLAALKRINKFLLEDEKIDKSEFITFLKDSEQAVTIENGSFEMGKFKMDNLNLSIKKGELVIICGKTRSGKSTLLKTILGETYRCEDASKDYKFELCGKIAYVSQEPWIENKSIVDNITLDSKDPNAEKIEKIVEVCCLKKDLEKFNDDIHTEIGENGTTISGGQKSRISLAKALYFAPDIYLLDNILSSLDSFVANHIFHYCIQGYVKEKTKILVTNKFEFFPYADKIILLDDGKIVECGKYEELIKNGKEFYEFTKGYYGKKMDSEKIKKQLYEAQPDLFGYKMKESVNHIQIIEDEEKKKGNILSKKTMNCYYNHLSGLKGSKCGMCIFISIILAYFIPIFIYLLYNLHIANLVERKMYHMKEGNLFTSTYIQNSSTDYFGNPIVDEFYLDDGNCSTFLSNYINSSLECLVENVEISWLKDYTNGTVVNAGLTMTESFMVLILVIFGILIFLLIQVNIVFSVLLKASKSLFESALTSLFATPMSFIYKNVIGRIISRLSYDVMRLDYDFIIKFEISVFVFWVTIGILGLIAFVTNGTFMIGVLIIFIFIGIVFYYFNLSIMELKRLESISRSAFFHHFTQSLDGHVQISTFNLVDEYIQKNKELINFHNKSNFLMESVKRMLEAYMSIAGCLTILFVCSCCIILSYIMNNEYSLILSVGITNLLTLVDLFSMVMRNIVNIEVQGNAIERLEYYENLISEVKAGIVKDINVSEGSIEFRGFNMKYNAYDTKNVLKDINIKINSKEKVCIIGKTGCGKTSMMLCLLRIIEESNENGEIIIDNQSLNTCSKISIRENISVIPQTVVLFKGSVRSNLDPFSKNNDDKIWKVLEEIGMKSIVTGKGGLDARIDMESELYSLGEKRLLVLASCLLKNNKILLVDEATSISYKIDDTIQNVVTSQKDTTVISITHRLDNLIHYDKILVLNEGEIEEFETLENLISNQDSFLYKLVDLLPNKQRLLKLFISKSSSKNI